jgi:hypothetical protein
MAEMCWENFGQIFGKFLANHCEAVIWADLHMYSSPSSSREGKQPYQPGITTLGHRKFPCLDLATPIIEIYY